MNSRILDSNNDDITVTNFGSGNATVNALDGVPLTTSDGTATGQVVVATKQVGSGALPSGAATSAKQDTGNTSLASIDTKTPALGQALAAASTPVILPAATITTLTPPAAITGFATAVKQPALGTATAPSTDVLTVSRPAVTQVISTALEASRVLKASAGQLTQLSIFNSKASAQFLLLMNSTTLPADGAVTLLFPPIPIAAATLLVLDIPAPLVASTGITICNSSTGTFTKTIGSADCVFYAQVN